MKVKCFVCGYEVDILNRKCLWCNVFLFEVFKCLGNCKSCKKSC